MPNNSALVLPGDVNPAEVMKMAQEFYGDWPKREKDPFIEFPLVEHPPLPKSEGVVIVQPVVNVLVNISWHGPSLGEDNPATSAAGVFSVCLREPSASGQQNRVDAAVDPGRRM